MNNVILPKGLKRGDTIGVVSPGRWMSEEDLRTGTDNLRKQGFSVFIHEQNYLRHHQFAGKVEARRRAVEDLFNDPTVDAIMFAKGGYGTLHILDGFDYEAARRNPKIITGYSDATALLFALNIKVGLVTFHGPMIYDFLPHINEFNWDHFLRLTSTGDAYSDTFDSEFGVTVLRSGIADGRTLAGNLALMVNLLGTDSEFDAEDVILFLEDDEEYLYSVDRMFLHLKRSGKLAKLAGLVIGRFTNLKDNKVPFGYSVEEIAAYHCRDYSFPIVTGFPFGHGGSQISVPIGTAARLEAGDDNSVLFSIKGPAVQTEPIYAHVE